MKIIDGSQGEGGGQILRTALSLSMCLKQPIKLHSIRAGRKKSGLLRQHLTCVRAAKEVCQAKVIGDYLGSDSIEFYPGNIQSGDYHFAIATAGSTTLVFQTILPALSMADDMSSVVFEGGTHNSHAPSFDFIDQAFLPIIELLGIRVERTLIKYGFYPNGGGQWQAKIYPINTNKGEQKRKTVSLSQRGAILARKAQVISSQIPAHIGVRELKKIKKQCHWQEDELQHCFVDSYGPGNIVSLRLKAKHVNEVFEAVGSLGIPAEQVATQAIKAMKDYLQTDVVIGIHLADQLLLPLVLASGGCYTTLKPSSHTVTNIQIIELFMKNTIVIEQLNERNYNIIVAP